MILRKYVLDDCYLKLPAGGLCVYNIIYGNIFQVPVKNNIRKKLKLLFLYKYLILFELKLEMSLKKPFIFIFEIFKFW